MSKRINLIIIVLFTLTFHSCKKDECPEAEKEHTFTGVCLENVTNGDPCGYEILIFKGLEKVNLISESGIDDSLFYTRSLPVQIGDTFTFTARKSKGEEIYTCNPLGISGFKQIKILKIEK